MIQSDQKEKAEPLQYDTLVIGGGIAGEEASLSLANMGFKVLLWKKIILLAGR